MEKLAFPSLQRSFLFWYDTPRTSTDISRSHRFYQSGTSNTIVPPIQTSLNKLFDQYRGMYGSRHPETLSQMADCQQITRKTPRTRSASKVLRNTSRISTSSWMKLPIWPSAIYCNVPLSANSIARLLYQDGAAFPPVTNPLTRQLDKPSTLTGSARNWPATLPTSNKSTATPSSWLNPKVSAVSPWIRRSTFGTCFSARAREESSGTLLRPTG